MFCVCKHDCDVRRGCLTTALFFLICRKDPLMGHCICK
nr:MAG TPA: hypothetical protein [Caudoviricetes sp.]